LNTKSQGKHVRFKIDEENKEKSESKESKINGKTDKNENNNAIINIDDSTSCEEKNILTKVVNNKSNVNVDAPVRLKNIFKANT
jgi:hypothetical protein